MAYRDRWLEYFEVVDADKSGFIDPGDIAYALPAVAKLFNKPETSPEVVAASNGLSFIMHRIIENFDQNKDGKVSKEELLAGVEQHFKSKKIDDLPGWWKEYTTTCFNSADTNKNGFLSLEEFAFLKNFNPKITDEELKAAYDWGAKRSVSGKSFDATSLSEAYYHWATDSEPFPEARVILPFFYKN